MQIIVFILVFGVVVAFHEFGHYYFAKKSGVAVKEFAIGMGPKIFASFKNGTAYTIRALPLGGYVRLASDLDDGDEPIKKGQTILVQQDEEGLINHIYLKSDLSLLDAFPIEVHDIDLIDDMTIRGVSFEEEAEQVWAVSTTALIQESDGTVFQVSPRASHVEYAHPLKKMLINVAGPLNNFILSIVLFILLAFMSGGVNSTANDISLQADAPAAQAGLQSGDLITSVGGVETSTWAAISEEIAKLKSEGKDSVQVTYSHQGTSQSVTIPFSSEGYIGIMPGRHTGLGDMILSGFQQTWYVITIVWGALANMVLHGFDINAFGGPVAIAQQTSQVTAMGLLAILSFIGLLSANLGVMNLLPIPALDGGKIILNLLELLRGKPISREKETIVTLIGVGILVILMLAVTFNDIMRLFR